MNQNKKVLQFVLLATGCLLALSLFINYKNISNAQLQNISIITDIVSKDTLIKSIPKTPENTSIKTIEVIDTIDKNVIVTKKLLHFILPSRITNFSTDTNSIVLDNFIKKLIALRKTKKGKRQKWADPAFAFLLLTV